MGAFFDEVGGFWIVGWEIIFDLFEKGEVSVAFDVSAHKNVVVVHWVFGDEPEELRVECNRD